MSGSSASKTPDDIEDRDPGLARERTDLAWTRTSISFAALGAAMLRTSPIAGVLVLATATAVWLLGHLSSHVMADDAPGRRLSSTRTVQLITLATTAVSVLTFVIALVSPGRSPL